MAENEVYVQSVRLKLRKENGEIIESTFIGLALCSPEEWEEISKMSLGTAMTGVSSPLMITDPALIDSFILDNDNGDIIDAFREELNDKHHEELKEEKPETQ